MNEELKIYWQYLRDNNADVPDTFESFHRTLQDDVSAKKYYDYLKEQGFDAPDTFESFSNTLGLKKKESTGGFTTPSPLLVQEPDPGPKDFLDQITYKPEEEPVVGTIPPTPLDPSEQRAEKFLSEMERRDFEQLQRDTELGQTGIKKPFVQELINAPAPVMRAEDAEKNAKAVVKSFQEEITGNIEPQGTITDITEDLKQVPPSFNKGIISVASTIPKGVAILAKKLDDLTGARSEGIEKYSTYQLGQWIEDKAKEIGITAVNDKRAGFMNSTVPMAFGQMMGMMLTGGVGNAQAGLVPQSIARQTVNTLTSPIAISGALQASVPEYEAAKAAGKSDEEAFGVFLKNIPGGMTEVIPIANMFSKLNKITGNGLLNALKLGTAQGLEEGSQEAVQQYLTNKIAQGTYDPKRDLKEGLLEGAGAGFIVGFLMPGVMGAMDSMTPDQKNETRAIIDEILKKPKEDETAATPKEEPAAKGETTKEEALPVQGAQSEVEKTESDLTEDYDYDQEVFNEQNNIDLEEYGLELNTKEDRVKLSYSQRGKMIKGEDSKINEFSIGDKIVNSYNGQGFEIIDIKSKKSRGTAEQEYILKDLKDGSISTEGYRPGSGREIFQKITPKLREGVQPEVKGEEVKPTVTQDVTPDTVEEKPKEEVTYIKQELDGRVLYEDIDGNKYEARPTRKNGYYDIYKNGKKLDSGAAKFSDIQPVIEQDRESEKRVEEFKKEQESRGYNVDDLVKNLKKAFEKPFPEGITGFEAHFTPEGYRTEIRKENGKYNFYLNGKDDARPGDLPKLTKAQKSKPIASFDNEVDTVKYAIAEREKYNKEIQRIRDAQAEERKASKEETFGKFKVIGVNTEGNKVGEDNNGVRGVLKGSVIVSQPVGVIPGQGISVSSPEGQFMTKEESKAQADKIAQDAGFDNASHLINSVKKRTGQEFENVQDIPKNVIEETVKSREEEKGKRAEKLYEDLTGRKVRPESKEEKPKITQIKEANPERILVVKPTPSRKSDAKFEKARKSAGDLLDLIGPGLKINEEYDPIKAQKVILKAGEVVANYIDAGVTRFAEMVQDILETYGEQAARVLFDPMKKGYGSQLASVEDEVLRQMDELKDVRATKIEDILKTQTDEQTGTTTDQPGGGAGVGIAGDNETEQTGGVEQGEPSGSQETTGTSGEQLSGVEGGVPELGDDTSGSPQGGDTGRIRPELADADVQHNFVYPENWERNKNKTFSKRQAYKDNIAALEVVSALLDNPELFATDAQKQILSRYNGLGPLGEILLSDNKGADWSKTNLEFFDDAQRLKELLKEIGTKTKTNPLKTAKESSLNAYYTSLPVIRSIWDGLTAGNFNGGRILEGSMGSGRFIGGMPPHVMSASRIKGVDLDVVSSLISRYLYPKVSVSNSGLQEASVPSNYYDLFISNIPFGTNKVYDPQIDKKGPLWKESQSKIHTYFFAKAIDSVRPGGYIAILTSANVLDSQSNQGIRDLINQETDFIGAVRLSSDAFNSDAGTQVVTDIVLLRKKVDKSAPSTNEDINTISTKRVPHKDRNRPEQAIKYNEYFQRHPDHVFGDEWEAGGLYSAESGYTLKGEIDTQALTKKLQELASKFPIVEQSESTEDVQKVLQISPLGRMVSGGIVEENGEYFKVQDYDQQTGKFTIEQIKKTVMPSAKDMPILESFVKTKNIYFDVLAKDKQGIDTKNERADLKKAIDAFVKSIKPSTPASIGSGNKAISRMLVSDPDFYAITSLVKDDGTYSDVVDKPIKTDLVEFTETDNPQEAIGYSINTYGRINLPFIQKVMGAKTEQEAIDKIQSEIFETPDGEVVEKTEYLSGNVVEKLKQAQQWARSDSKYDKNVTELEKVIPEPIPLDQIKFQLGMNYIPMKYTQQFFDSVFGQGMVTVRYNKATDDYDVETRVVGGEYEAQDDEGNRRGVEVVIKAALTKNVPIFTKIVDEQTIPLPKLTQDVRDKAERLQDEFEGLIQADPQMGEELAAIHNEVLNGIVIKVNDGSKLTFPGWSHPIYNLADHQKDAIMLMIQRMGGMIDHIVGGGKSFIMGAGGIKMKQLGLVNKPMITTMKSVIPGMVQDIKAAYPAARILSPKDTDFSASNRQRLFAQIANNEWDLIIISHENLGTIPLPSDFETEYINNELEELEAAIGEMNADKSDKWAVKQAKALEKRKLDLQARLQELQDKGKYASRTDFGVIGVDFLMVDECFPFDTPIFTNKGSIPIGEIVKNKLKVSVLSCNLETEELEWKEVVQWFTVDSTKKLCRVTHENGFFTCTTDHKIWTTEGYVKAENVSGKTLYSMRGAVHIPFSRAGEQQEEEILQQFMCGNMEKQAARKNGGVYKISKSSLGALEGQEKQTQFGKNESEQSDAQSRIIGENEEVNEREDLFIQGRKFNHNCATTDIIENVEFTSGVYNKDKGRKASFSFTPKLLQSGFGHTGIKNSDRGGWKNTQVEEVEVSGQKKNRGIERSRVVSVEILEPGSIDGYSDGSGQDSAVYDIEVADNHNFFAAGVLVSNCQQFKNLSFITKLRGTAGLGNPKGSKRASNLKMVARYLQKMHGGDKGIVFASGTPISNSLVELYNIFQYLRPSILKKLQMNSLDQFIKNFAMITSLMEKNVAGVIKNKTRLTKFVNVTELASLYSEVSDIRGVHNLKLERPDIKGGKPEIILIPQSETQKMITGAIYEASKQGSVGPLRAIGINPKGDAEKALGLVLTTLGTKASIDPRMVFPGIKADGGKVPIVAEKVKKIFDETKKDKGVQLVFADMGTPKNKDAPLGQRVRDQIIEMYGEDIIEEISGLEGAFKLKEEGELREKLVELLEIEPEEASEIIFKANDVTAFNVYGELKNQLTRMGIPSDQIAFIHDAPTKKLKEELFAKVKKGDIRVLVGSTMKMGTGVNVQNRVVAMHHIDVGWRPSDLEQRNGRGIRRGNMNKEVEIYYYGTMETIDAYRFGLLAKKQSGIDSFRAGANGVREMEFEDGESMTMSEFEAAISGDTRILDLEKLKAKAYKLKNRVESAKRANALRERRIRDSKDFLDRQRLQRDITKEVGEQLAKGAKIEELEDEVEVDGKVKKQKANVAIFKGEVDGKEYDTRDPNQRKEFYDRLAKKINDGKYRTTRVEVGSIAGVPLFTQMAEGTSAGAAKVTIGEKTWGSGGFNKEGYSPEVIKKATVINGMSVRIAVTATIRDFNLDVENAQRLYEQALLASKQAEKIPIVEAKQKDIDDLAETEAKRKALSDELKAEAKKNEPGYQEPEEKETPNKPLSDMIKDISDLGAGQFKDIDGMAMTSFIPGLKPKGKVRVKPNNNKLIAHVVSKNAQATPEQQLQEAIQFNDPEVQKRFDESRVWTTQNMESFFDTIKDWAKGFSQHFKYLNAKAFPREANILREFETLNKWAKGEATRYMKGLISTLTPEQYTIFSNRIILADLLDSIKRGENMAGVDGKFPFGLSSVQEIEAEFAKFDELMKADPVIEKAFNARESFMEAFKQELISSGLLEENEINDYYHRRVLEYQHDSLNENILFGKTIGDKKRSFQKRRTGTRGMDYNTNFIETEFKVVSEGLFELEKQKILKDLMAPYEVQLKELEKQFKAEYDKKMKELEDQYGPDSEEVKIHNDSKRALKRNYLNENIPDGYVFWRVSEENRLFWGKTVTQKVIDNALQAAADNDQSGMSDAMKVVDDLVGSLQMGLMVGSKRKQYMVPKELAQQLEELAKDKELTIGSKIVNNITSLWKRHTLLFPTRILRYNLNNLGGDIDRTLQVEPAILKYGKESFKELYDYYTTGKTTDQLLEAMRGDVISSGFQISELSDLKKEDWVKWVDSKSDLTVEKVMGKEWVKANAIAIANKPADLYNKYMEAATKIIEFREGVLRYAAYKLAAEKVKKGVPFYWASDPKQIDKITNERQKIAKLAREVYGDYSNISITGQELRRNLLPFYSWAEINMKTHWQLIKNASSPEVQRRMIATGLAKGLPVIAVKMAWAYTKLALFSAAVQAWNYAMFGGDDDDDSAMAKLRRSTIKGLQVIVDVDPETGFIKTLPIQGTFYDFLDFLGIPSGYTEAKDIVEEKNDATVERLLDVPGAMYYQTTNRVSQMLTPFVKMPFELWSKEKFFPDVRNPIPFRDSWEYVAETVALKDEYNYIFSDAPKKENYWKRKWNNSLFLREFDTELLAYYATKKIIREYKGGATGYETGQNKVDQDKSKAAYYYALSKRYGNTEAADKYLNQFIQLEIKAIGQEYTSTGTGTAAALSKLLLGTGNNPAKDLNILETNDLVKLFADPNYKPVTAFGKSLTPREIAIMRDGTRFYNRISGFEGPNALFIKK